MSSRNSILKNKHIPEVPLFCSKIATELDPLYDHFFQFDWFSVVVCNLRCSKGPTYTFGRSLSNTNTFSTTQIFCTFILKMGVFQQPISTDSKRAIHIYRLIKKYINTCINSCQPRILAPMMTTLPIECFNMENFILIYLGKNHLRMSRLRQTSVGQG